MLFFKQSHKAVAPVLDRGNTPTIQDLLDLFAAHVGSRIHLTEHLHKKAHEAALKALKKHLGGELPVTLHHWHHILLTRLVIEAHADHHKKVVDEAWGTITPWREALCAELAALLSAPEDHSLVKYQSLHPDCWHLAELAHEFEHATVEELLAILVRMMKAQERGLDGCNIGLLGVLRSLEAHERHVGHPVKVEPEPRRKVSRHVPEKPRASAGA